METQHLDDLRFLIIDTLLKNAQFSKDDGVDKLIDTAKVVYDFVRYYEGEQNSDVKED